jgi:hypothetical protein
VSSSATCKWVSNAWSIRISPSATEFIDVNDTIRVKGGMLRSPCPSGSQNNECARWPVAPLQTCQVQAPSLVIVPVVVISAPSTIDPCSDFILDASYSSGSGGQSFSSKSVEVSSATGADVASIQTFYDAYFSVNPPVTLPFSNLEILHTYAFKVMLCNFVGNCSSAVHELSVINATVPVVSMPGESQRYVHRADEVVIDSISYLSVCGVSRSTTTEDGLLFEWKVYKNSYLIGSISSGSSRKSRFLVKAYELEFDKTYKFELTVTALSSGNSATASVFVNLEHTQIVAKLVGNNLQKSLRVGDVAVIDGSLSYDADVNAEEEDSSLHYSWSCTQLHPVVSSTCGLSVTTVVGGASNPTTADVNISPVSESYIGSIFIVTLTVKSADFSRVGTVSTEVTITNSLAPKLTISASSDAILYSDQYQVQAEAVVFGDVTEDSAWTVDDSSLVLQEIALTSVSFSLIPGTHVLDLLVGGSSLYAGATLTFSLTVGSVKSSVEVLVREPPRAGSFSVSPTTGAEFTDLFVMTTSRWSSEELPLAYTFGCLVMGHPEGRMAVVQQGSGKTSARGLWLPAGLNAMGYAVTSAVTVQDNLDSLSSLSALVTVTSSFYSDTVFETFIDEELSLMNPENNIDSIRAMVAASISKLNTVSCFQAPSCSVLHRTNCLLTQDTCGVCADGYFGASGDGNSLCYANSTLFVNSSELSQPCVLHSECFSGQTCNDRVCSYLPKTCSPVCASNGVCAFRATSTDEVIDECDVGDSSCEAVCVCGDGYTGARCSLLSSGLESKRRIRTSLVVAYNSTIEYDDLGTVSITLSLPELYALSANELHLSETSCGIIYHILDWSLLSAIEHSVPYAELGLLYSALDNCAPFLRNYAETSARRRLASGDCDGQGRDGLLISLTDYIEKKLEFSDPDVDHIQSFSRTKTKISSALYAFSMAVPRTPLEAAFFVEKSFVSITAANMILSPGSTSLVNPLLVATLEENMAKLYCNSSNFISDPVTMRVSLSSGYALLSTGYINATLAFSRPQTFISSSDKSVSDRVVYSTNCTLGNFSTFEYTCPTGETVRHDCPGKDKLFVSYCPEVLYHPVCRLLVNGTVSADNATCVRLSYTPGYIECSCQISGSIDYFSSSRTTSTDSLTFIGSFEVVALGIVSSKGGVVDTNERGVVPEEEEAAESVVVLILLCIMWALGVCCVMYLFYSFLNDVMNEGGSKFKARRSLQVLDNVSINEKRPFIVNYFNQCLPEIFQSFRVKNNEKDKILGELYRCHRYAKLFVASGSKAIEARLNNGLHLLTVWHTLILFLVIFYDAQVCFRAAYFLKNNVLLIN